MSKELPDGVELPPLPPIEIRKHNPTEVFSYAANYARAAILADREKQAARVPDGWKLVPVEPTREMCKAAVVYANGSTVYKNVPAAALEIEEGIYGEAYAAMLAAARTTEPSKAEQRPQNCGSGFCSCIECPFEPSKPEQADVPNDWREHVEHRIRTWQQRTMNKSGDRLSIDDFMGQDSIDDLVDFVCDEWATQPPASNAGEREDHKLFAKGWYAAATRAERGDLIGEIGWSEAYLKERDRLCAALATKPQAGDVAQDSARLDWLESNATEKLLNPSGFHCELIPDNRLRYEFPTLVSYDAIGQQISLRDAIDAARTRGEGGGT